MSSAFFLSDNGSNYSVSANYYANGVIIAGSGTTFLGFGDYAGKATPDVKLFRDTANTLALRNGTAAQTFNLYKTYTDASNYERVVITGSGVVFGQAGTGSIRNISIANLGFANISFETNGSGRWAVADSGHFIAQTDNVYDFGSMGSNRARNGYFGTAVFAGATVSAFSATAIPSGGTAGTGFRFSSTSNFGVFFGSGVPSLAAAKGSLYLRSDGSGTTDRVYVNTDGSTTWTAITTAS